VIRDSRVVIDGLKFCFLRFGGTTSSSCPIYHPDWGEELNWSPHIKECLNRALDNRLSMTPWTQKLYVLGRTTSSSCPIYHPNWGRELNRWLCIKDFFNKALSHHLSKTHAQIDWNIILKHLFIGSMDDKNYGVDYNLHGYIFLSHS